MIFSVLAILPPAFGCSHTSSRAPEAERVAYFAALPFRESPFTPLSGTHELSEAQARERNHYRFEYDADNHLIEASFRMGDHVRDLDGSESLFFLAPLIRVAREPNREIRYFFDKHRNPITVRGSVYREVYHLDDKGFYEALHFEDIQGKPIANSWDIARYQWEIQPDGSVIEDRLDMDGKPEKLRPGFDFYRLHLFFGIGGNLALMRYIDDSGNMLENNTGAAQDKLEFDADGNMLAWNVLDDEHRLVRGNGPNVARGVQSFDRYGLEIGVRYEDEQGRAIPNSYGFWSSTSVYDQHGNLVSRVFEDSGGKPIPHEKAGYTRLRITWDETASERLGMLYMDANGAPVAHEQRGYAELVQEYDRHHNPTRITYLGTRGEKVNRTDIGIAEIARQYDSRKRLVEERFLDARGQLVNHARRGYAVTRYRFNDTGLPLPPLRFDLRMQLLSGEE